MLDTARRTLEVLFGRISFRDYSITTNQVGAMVNGHAFRTRHNPTSVGFQEVCFEFRINVPWTLVPREGKPRLGGSIDGDEEIGVEIFDPERTGYRAWKKYRENDISISGWSINHPVWFYGTSADDRHMEPMDPGSTAGLCFDI